jgi:hypothetical protein
MTSEASEIPGFTLPPAPTPAWEVMENLQQAQAVRYPRPPIRKDLLTSFPEPKQDTGWDNGR